MNKQDKKLYVFLAIALTFAVFFIISFSKTEIPVLSLKNDTSVINENTNTLEPTVKKVSKIKTPKTETKKGFEESIQSVTVLAGETTIHLPFTPPAIFYDVLVKEEGAGNIDFAGKNYPGLGFFVTDIGTLHAGDGKSLLYYVNGKEATVGVSSYKLQDGDIIEWKLE